MPKIKLWHTPSLNLPVSKKSFAYIATESTPVRRYARPLMIKGWHIYIPMPGWNLHAVLKQL